MQKFWYSEKEGRASACLWTILLEGWMHTMLFHDESPFSHFQLSVNDWLALSQYGYGNSFVNLQVLKYWTQAQVLLHHILYSITSKITGLQMNSSKK